MPRRFAALFLFMLVLGCDSSEPAFDMDDYIGTYEGTRTGTNEEGSSTTENVSFTVSADIELRGVVARGSVKFLLDSELDIPRVLLGIYNDDGIQISRGVNYPDWPFSVNRNGYIEGIFIEFGETITISGLLSSSQLNLTFRNEDGEIISDIQTSR